MRILNRKDIISALVTGLTTGVIATLILGYLGKKLPLGISPTVLIWLVPILWLAGVQLGYALVLVAKPFAQFGRFVAIGFANAMVDFGILYLLIDLTGYTGGIHYAVFKTVSFSIALVHSFLWNKFWVFDAGSSGGGAGEAARFASVGLVSAAVNVLVASLVNVVHPASVDPRAWAGIAAIVGSAAAIVFSFIGFRLFVFRKK